jgi:threonine dehydrogenase-like Zn-dependent dehydrogenase
MRALTWQGEEQGLGRDRRGPRIELPTDAVIRVTSTAICGSDLHLYEALGPFLRPGVSSATRRWASWRRRARRDAVRPGDRVVVPFNISCGSCWMCSRGLYAQCETTQVRSQGKGASLFGYTELYGSVPGGRPSTCGCRKPTSVRSRCRTGSATIGSSICPTSCPTAWQAFEFADVPADGTVAVFGSARWDS